MSAEKMDTGTTAGNVATVFSEGDKNEAKAGTGNDEGTTSALHSVTALSTTPKRRGPGRPKLGGIRASQRIKVCEEELDTSWKDSGEIFPKSSSRVGNEYQVDILPQSGTYDMQSDDEPMYDLIWDYKEAQKKEMLNFIEDNVPHNKREKALQVIHDNNYSLMNPKEIIRQIDPTNVSDWTLEEKEKFRIEIFRSRKNFKEVIQKMMGKKMGDTIAYYLGYYKKSDDYRLLKTVCVEERIEKAKDHCVICDQGGSLLICDGCESEWHMTCAKPALKTVPESRWECDVCVDRKFLESRKRILEDISSNMNDQKQEKKMKVEVPLPVVEINNDVSKGLPLHIIAAVKACTSNISSILSTSRKQPN